MTTKTEEKDCDDWADAYSYFVERAEKLFWKLVSIHSTNNASSVREIAFEFAKVRDETLEEAAKRAPHQIAYNIRALKLGQSGGGK